MLETPLALPERLPLPPLPLLAPTCDLLAGTPDACSGLLPGALPAAPAAARGWAGVAAAGSGGGVDVDDCIPLPLVTELQRDTEILICIRLVCLTRVPGTRKYPGTRYAKDRILAYIVLQ